MKDLKQLLAKKPIGTRAALDEKSIFFVFQKVIKDEYGRQGEGNLIPHYLKDKKIFIKAGNSNWANELWLSKGNIIQRINREIGSEEITDIALS